MLPRTQRLRRTTDIQAVLRTGRCLGTPYVRICTKATPLPTSRVACVVGKSVDPSAVRRHRYQRWLRHTAHRFLTELKTGQSYDMVWVALPALAQVDRSADLNQQLKPYLNKLAQKLT